MSSPLPETWSKRLVREYDDAVNMRRKRPFVFILIILGIMLWLGWQAYSSNRDTTKLTDEVLKKDHDILLLNTQLAPFRTVALQQFPGKKEGEALAELATKINQLQEQFEKTQEAIHSFSARISYEIRGEWIKGHQPGAGPMLKLTGNGDPVGGASFVLNNGKSIDLNFNDAIDDTATNTESNYIRCESTFTVSVGCPIFNLSRKDLSAISRLRFTLFEVTGASVVNPVVEIRNVRVTFFINGIQYAECSVGKGVSKIDVSQFSRVTSDGLPPGPISASWSGNAVLSRL